jgi:hypothetical protein
MQQQPRRFAFVLMPFDKAFDDVYKLGIKGAVASFEDVIAERVDEQIYREGILERIYRQIEAADIIIADMTGQSHQCPCNLLLLDHPMEPLPRRKKTVPQRMLTSTLRRVGLNEGIFCNRHFRLCRKGHGHSLNSMRGELWPQPLRVNSFKIRTTCAVLAFCGSSLRTEILITTSH